MVNRWQTDAAGILNTRCKLTVTTHNWSCCIVTVAMCGHQQLLLVHSEIRQQQGLTVLLLAPPLN